MRVFLQIVEITYWLVLGIVIPAILLYPAALWLLKHSHLSEHLVAQGYLVGVVVSFLPTGFLVEFVCRRFIFGKRRAN